MTYESVPLLNEAITSLSSMIKEFEHNFHIDLEDKGFTNAVGISQKTDFGIAKENLNATTEYYSSVMYNAKGAPYFWNLSINMEERKGMFSKYYVREQVYFDNYDITLNEVSPGYYEILLQGQVIHYVGIKDDVIYIYASDSSIDTAKQDVESNAGQFAEVVLTKQEIPIIDNDE